MKLDVVCNKQDEYYTPLYAIKPIAKYISPNSTIWCPFDTDISWTYQNVFEIQINLLHQQASQKVYHIQIVYLVRHL